MIKRESSQFKKAADSAAQANLICTLVENYPNKLSEDEVSVFAALIKKLTSDTSQFFCHEILKNETE
ncbi:hypothetical protein [uncultured Serratia sp.]|uniref:hypothetical protein n=1 Tax=uncultured Serratia sp. TaxID=239175 RepID=UPI00258D0854|nr:hypothetical protein [uncultured Serratia sp.]